MGIGLFPSTGPSAIAAVNRAVGVKKDDAPSLIVIKLKQIQVKPIGLDDSHADKLFFQRLEFLVLTNNLLVDCLAGRSRNSAKKREDRLARLPRLSDRGRHVVVDPMRRDLDVLRLLRLSEHDGWNKHSGGQYSGNAIHESPFEMDVSLET